ncbi:MAG: hypothetical protein IJD38_05860 [Clostridia bacterium]|nr:hypothetical protein [Clostridia bacterium]
MDGNKFLSTKEVVPALGFDSVTNYQFVHFVDINRDYANILPGVAAEWARMDQDYTVPFYPHVSIGWDNSPRLRGFVGYGRSTTALRSSRRGWKWPRSTWTAITSPFR